MKPLIYANKDSKNRHLLDCSSFVCIFGISFVSHTATEATYDGCGPHCPTSSHHLCWFALELGTVCCSLMISVSVEHYVCLVGWLSQNAHGRIRVSNTQASIFTTVAKQQGICNRFPNLDQKWHVESGLCKFCKKRRGFWLQCAQHTHTYTHTCVYIYIYMKKERRVLEAQIVWWNIIQSTISFYQKIQCKWCHLKNHTWSISIQVSDVVKHKTEKTWELKKEGQKN